VKPNCGALSYQWKSPARGLGRWRGTLTAILGYVGLTSTAYAQGVFYTPDPQPAAWDVNHKVATWDIILAAGVAMQPTFHGSDRYRATPVPLVIIRWRDAVSLGADGLTLYWHDNNLRIGGGVNYDGGRLGHETSGILNSGDNRLAGLGDVDGSVGLRGFASYKWGPVYLDASAIKYIGPQNKGILANFGISSPWALTKRFVIRPHIGATWANDNYMQTFFGITPTQAAQSRFPQFNTEGGLEDVHGGLTGVYFLSSHWFIGADASAIQYMGNAARSPITISNTNATFATVIGYHF
jgi:outer membrane protein